MKLGDWLRKNGLSQRGFAAKARIPCSVVGRVVTDGRDCSGAHWARIMRATGGQVTPADHFPPERQRSKRSAA